jgi:NitT/TauT family transport system substrate-binding protein
MKRRVAAILALILLMGLPAFGQDKEQKEPFMPMEEYDFLILAPRSTSTIPLLLAAHLDREYDIAPGIAIRVEFFASHPQALARLLRGDVDALLTGTSQGWENHLDGGPIVMLGTGVWGVSSMMSNIPGLTTPTDFEGLRVALPFPGSPLDVQMRYILIAMGLDPDEDLKISYSSPTQTVGLLLTGKIDAAPLPEPLATNLEMERGLHRSFEIPMAWAEVMDGDPMSPQVSLFATDERAYEDTGLFHSVVRAWESASHLVGAHPESFGGMFAEALELPPHIVIEALFRTMLFVPPPEENEMQVRRYFEIVQSVYPEDRRFLEPQFFVPLEPPMPPMEEPPKEPPRGK